MLTGDGDWDYAFYSYRPDGLRREKADNLIPFNTLFVWDGGNLVFEQSEINGGEEITENVCLYGIGLISGTFTSTYYGYRSGRTRGTTVQFRQYFTDGHGDVTALANENGYICQSYAYDAFGNLISGSITGANRFLYASEYYDTELGTYYLRMRYYEPRTGVFLTEDPARDGLNWYSYCAANPVCYVDPWGTDAIWLQYDDGAKGFGHSGLLLQSDEGIWFLFYWGTNASFGDYLLSDVDAIAIEKVFQEIGSHRFEIGDSLTDDINEFLKTKNELLGGVTDSLYFSGDFSNSISYIEKNVNGRNRRKEDIPKMRYNLYYNNCMQLSARVLQKGEFAEKDSEYKKALELVSYELIPNHAFDMLVFYDIEIKVQARIEKMQKRILNYIFYPLSKLSNLFDR